MDVYFLVIVVGLFVMVIVAYYAGQAIGKRYMFEIMQQVVDEERKKAVKKSRSVLKGQFSEQMSPFNKDFPAKSSECRFLGAPIDFVSFRGLDEKNVEEVVFIEVKTGKSNLNQTEKSIKQAILNKKVRFEEYRIN
jgi:predicted Holliday junction resolvase-like endonuclease